MDSLYKEIDYDESLNFHKNHKTEKITLEDVNSLKAFDYMQISEDHEYMLICGMEERGEINISKYEDNWFVIDTDYLCDGTDGVFKCVDENFNSLFRPYRYI